MTGTEDRATPPTEPRLDLRLMLPALVAWAVLTAVVAGPVWLTAAVGLVATSAAVVLLHAWQAPPSGRSVQSGRESLPSGEARRSGPAVRSREVRLLVRGQAAMGLAAVGLVCLACAAHVARDRSGPVQEWAAEGAVASVTATVTLDPKTITRGDERDPLVIVELRLQEVTARGATVASVAPVVAMAPAGEGWEDLAWRSTIRAEGRLREAEPGRRQVAVLVPRGEPVTTGRPGPVLRATDHVRDRFRQAVAPLPADARGLVPGLVIGDTSLTPPDLTEDMRATGMTHLSAVSGSNVALVTGALALLIGHAGVPRRWRTPVVLVGLVGFVLLCRPEPSVMRAAVMGSVGLLALSSARRRVSLPALGAAVLGLLCVDPWLARSYGFALSTLATLGLVVWSRPWGDAMASRLPRRLALLGDAVSVPLAAQVACAPVLVLLQGNITTVAVLANLLAAPLVAPTTVLGVGAAVISPLSLTLATLVAWLAAIPAWILGRIARVGADLPYGTVDWVDGPTGALLLTGLTVVALVTGPWWRDQLRRRPWWGYGLLGVVAGLAWPSPALQGWPPPGWVVVGCDVGQGDAFVVRSAPESVIVVDTGPEPGAVARCLRDLGVSQVEGLFLTHYHSDHVAGTPGVLAQAEVSTTYVSPVLEPEAVSEVILEQLRAEAVVTQVVRAGQTLTLGEAVVEVLSPGERPVVGGSAANNASLVLDVVVDGTRLLLTGDIEPEAARPLRRAVDGRDYDILKVAHHGSAAQDPTLVSGTRAEIALIGVGADNTFGHPAPRALELLHRSGMVVLRTDTDGDIAVSRDGQELVVHRRGR